MTETKRGGWTLLLASIISSVGAFAQSIQSAIEPFTIFADLFKQGKVLIFIGAWIAASALIWRIFSIIRDIVKQKAGLATGDTGKGSIGLIILSAILTFHSVAIPAKAYSKPLFSLLSWAAFIVGFSLIEVISARLNKGENEKKISKKEFGIIATTYFIVSIFIAPFASLSAGSNIFAIIFVHLAIAVFIETIGSSRVEKEEEAKTIAKTQKEEAKARERLYEERMYAERVREQEHQRELERLKIEVGLKGKEESVIKLQDYAATQAGNLPALYPLLVKMAQGLPAQLPTIVSWISRKDELNQMIQTAEKDIEKRKKLVKGYKEEYTTTKVGAEATYLINTLKELENNKGSWAKYVSSDGGKHWDKCLFADEIGKFTNKGSKETADALRATVSEGGREKAIEIMKKRFKVLMKERKEKVSEYENQLSTLNAVSPAFIDALKKRLAEENAIETQLRTYVETNNKVSQDLEVLRQSLVTAATAETTENQRRTLLMSTIPITFKKLEDDLKSLANAEKIYEELIKSNIVSAKQAEEFAKKLEKLERYRKNFEEDFGTLREEAA